MLDPPSVTYPDRTAPKKFVVIYVASDNPHNTRAAKWFFDKVYPQLPEQIRLCVIGKISGHIGTYRNVTKISFAEDRSEEHTSELQSLMRISYAVFCLKKKRRTRTKTTTIVQRPRLHQYNPTKHI